MDQEASAHALKQIFGVILLAGAYLVVGVIRQYWSLRHFKGPRTTGWSWWWHSRAVLSGASHRHYSDVNERYGPIARVAPNLLLTSDPELWAKINAVRSPYTRAEWYYHAVRFEPGKDNVFTECDNEKHDSRRKKMASAYAGKENPTLEPSIDTHVKELVHLIQSKYASPATSTKITKPMDLASKIQYFTVDVISDVGLGRPFGDLKADKDVHGYIKSSEGGLRAGNTAFGLGTSWLRDLPIIGPALNPSERDASGFGKAMFEIRVIVDARRGRSTQEKPDMLASFIRNGVSGQDLFQEVFEQILAGSDTTAAAIRITLLFIMSHPRVYAKLQAEIDGAVKAGIAPASPEIISDFEARRLPYLSAVIREGMRIHPPVLNLFPRVAPPNGDVVNIDSKEYFVPGGTMIGYSGWSMHRANKSVYGEDAEVFRPERWLVDESKAEEKERLARMTRVNDMIFGHGRWSCLGRVVALIEIHKAIFELLRHFDFAITKPHEPWEVFDCMGLWTIRDMLVDVTERD